MATALALLASPPARAHGWYLYFDWGSAEITPAGEAVLDDFYASLSAFGFPRETVIGYADRSGSAADNFLLSLRRAAAVRAALIVKGVPPARITVAGRGEEPLLPTPDGTREQANREVLLEVEDWEARSEGRKG